MPNASDSISEHEPECLHAESEAIELLIGARPRDLGGFAVRRLLPTMLRHLVGPFIFFDHQRSFRPGRAST